MMICPQKLLEELIEIYKTRGYSTKQSVERAQRHIQRATV